MNLKNANLGVALGMMVFVAASLITGGEPNGLEAIATAGLTLGSALGLLFYLNERDRKLGRPLPPSLFRRSGSDGEGPG